MSRFAQSFKGYVAAAHNHHFACAVSVNEVGTPASTPAVLHTAKADTRTEDGDTVQVLTRRCRFTELTTIRHDAIITIDNLEWSIDVVHSGGVTGVECTLIRKQVTEQARSGYRK